MLVLLIFSVLVLLILLGFPIAVAMGLTAIGFFLGLGEPRMIGAMAQRMYSGVSSFPLLAIPFFILAGNLMNTGGMTDRIFGFARTVVGHVRGGLAHVSVLASMLFAGVSGAALAEAMGLGVIEVKAMKGIEVPFKDAGKLAPEAIYNFAKKVFLEHGPVDGIYMLGAGWHNLPVIEMLEKDLKTTVLSSIPAQVWATKKILHLNEPVSGYGRLLGEMP